MKRDIEKIVEIEEGVSVSFDGNEATVKKDTIELKKKFMFGKIKAEVKDGKILFSAKKASKRENKMIGTIAAHLNNMIKGVQEPFVYKLEIANVHFPMSVKADGNIITIKSFLGEKQDRTCKICDNVKVDIKGSQIEVSSNDIEAAGQTAANLEKATKVKNRDRRIFQDGIFITEKPGRII